MNFRIYLVEGYDLVIYHYRKLNNSGFIQPELIFPFASTGLMMADRHPTGCRSPSLLCNGKMPVGEYWTISLCADWGKLMAAIGINPPPIEWTIGINF